MRRQDTAAAASRQESLGDGIRDVQIQNGRSHDGVECRRASQIQKAVRCAEVQGQEGGPNREAISLANMREVSGVGEAILKRFSSDCGICLKESLRLWQGPRPNARM